MADLKFSALTPAGALNGTEEVPVVKTGSKKTTTQAIADLHTDAVSQVNGQAGVVALDQDDIGDGVTYKQYSATEKTKLAGIAAGAEVNVNADWNSVAGDSLIQNKPTLGTAAAKNIPATGDASATEVVYGTDSRLTDARTPLSHTHTGVYAPVLGADDNYVTDAEKVKLSNLSGTNTGDQTSIVGITGTKAQFDTAVTDGNIMYIGDAPTSHTHTKANITDFTHTHVKADVTDFAHTHVISDTTGLQTALDNKVDDTQLSGLSKITVGTSAPGSPSVGDIWVDTN